MTDLKALIASRNTGGSPPPVAAPDATTTPASYPLQLGTVTIPQALEARHILAVGTTGSGKSQAFYQILSTIRARKQSCILIDHSAEFMQRYYREGIDKIFAPFDVRSVGWSPFNEIRKIWDFDRIARALVPDVPGENQDWQMGAQQLMANIMRGLWKWGKAFRTNEALIYFVAEAPSRNIKNTETGEDDKTSLEFLCKGSTSTRLFETGNEKQLVITLGILGRYIQPLTYLKEGGFSMTDYVKQFENPGECESWLFLSYTDASYSAIRAMFSIMVACAVQSALELSESRVRRFYIALDEFSSLDKIDAMDDALTKLRKRGGVVIAGIQSTAQLEEKSGKVGAQILLSCFGNVLMLRVADDETAEKLSSMIGDYEAWDKSYSEGTSESTGGQNGSSGSTAGISHQKVTKRGVLPSEFFALPDLCGFVRIAGFDVCKQTMVPVSNLPLIAPGEIPRSGVELNLT